MADHDITVGDEFNGTRSIGRNYGVGVVKLQ